MPFGMVDRVLHAAGARPAPVDAQFRDVSRAYWEGPGAEAPRVGATRPIDDTLHLMPVLEEAPPSADPQARVWIGESLPQWNWPSFWSYPFESDFTVCIPTWEQEYNVGVILVPAMTMAVIRSVSYEVISGIAPFDVFECKLYDPALRVTWEDAIVDAVAAAPALRHGLAGDTLPLPIEYHGDRNKSLRFTVKARGVVTLAGASNHFPGELLLPNMFFRLSVQGWFAPLRDDLDGGVRPTDLGLMLKGI
jgi:hypothetical protein